jgi:O-acetyl-ADP-ribose deacetylase (regulator of RNase III)
MGTYKEINGDLISLTKEGMFDVIAHGCNCFCNMGAGIAVPMNKNFGCGNFKMEDPETMGDINKLGLIDIGVFYLSDKNNPSEVKVVNIVNAYTQYIPAAHLKPVDYEAITLCMRKINHKFKGKHVGLPKIGAGLAGGDWNRIKGIIQQELKDCDVTVVIFDK